MTTSAMIACPARPIDRRFWPAYLVTMRPYLLYVSGITGIAGLSLASGLSAPSLMLLGTIFFLSYGFGQALTDCFQIDTDSLSSPYRPLVRGTVLPQDVLAVSLIGLGASAAVVIWFNPLNAIAAGLTVLGLATYTYFKRRWWGGPWYNAWIVSLVVLIGYQAGTTAAPDARVVGTMLAAFAAYANFVLTGYYKDVAADRATGYRTLPVVFGRRVSARVSDAFAVLGFVGAALALSGHAWGANLLAAAFFLVPAAVLALVAQVRLRGVTRDADAQRAIEPVVHSYVLLLAGLAAANRPGWAPFLLLFYAAFAWTVERRPVAGQI